MGNKAATGGRQHISQPPGVVGSSNPREQYREQFASHFPPSNSPSPSDRSPSNSDSQSSSPSPTTELVPLEYLQNVSSPRREPVDEQLLRKISTHSVSPPTVPGYGQNAKPSMRAQSGVPPSTHSVARHAKSRYEAGQDASAKR